MLAGACASDDDAPGAPGTRAISFEARDDAQTRTGINTVTDLTGFRVWGWATDTLGQCTVVFDDQSVAKSGRNWVYTPLAYWMPNRSYRFLALTSNKAGTESGLGSVTASPCFTLWDQAATMHYTPAGAWPFTEDILYATYECETPDALGSLPKVPFSFRHLLARLKIKVRSATIDGCSVRLRSLTFTPKYSACTFSPVLITTQHELPPSHPGGEPRYFTEYDVLCPATPTLRGTTTYTMLADDPSGHGMPYEPEYLYLMPCEVGTFTVSYELWDDRTHALIRSFNDEHTIAQPLEGARSYQAEIILPSATSVVSLEATLEPWGADNDTDREILSI